MSEAPINPDLPILDDPEAGSTWFISLVSIVLLVVTVLALVVMYFGFEAAEVDRKVVDKPTMALEELRLSQEESLTGYGTYKVEDADGVTDIDWTGDNLGHKSVSGDRVCMADAPMAEYVRGQTVLECSSSEGEHYGGARRVAMLIVLGYLMVFP